jgi:hypothetical protein
MKKFVPALFCLFLFACNDNTGSEKQTSSVEGSQPASTSSADISGHWEGSFSNGMKGAKISFDISKDGTELKDLIFQGYWRCEGKLDLTTLGPEKSFSVQNNKADGVIVEPEGGGATAARFELHGTFNGNTAEGTFRMNINGLGCDTYKLKWTAEKK